MHTGMPCVCSPTPPCTYGTCPGRPPIKTFTSRAQRSNPSHGTTPPPEPHRTRTRNSCRSPEPPQLFPPLRATSHHHNSRHDHQTGQTDSWILPPPPEAGCRGGADAAAGPRHQPDSHDAGHHGPESVLLQCQADDGEGPGPARALKRLLTTLNTEING